MTASTHDCVEIRDQLLELIYDELEAPEAEALRSAAEACAECADELAKLEAGLTLAAALPLEEPSAGFEQRVMAMVHQELAGGAPQARPAEATAEGALTKAVRRLREWVAGPQVAMATLTLLVAALGIWYLPSRRAPVGAAGDTVVALEPDGEATATAPSAPAATWSQAREEAPRAQPAARARRAARDGSGRTLADAPQSGLDDVPTDEDQAQASPALATSRPAEQAAAAGPGRGATEGQGAVVAQAEAEPVVAELEAAAPTTGAAAPEGYYAEAPAASSTMASRPVDRRPRRRARAHTRSTSATDDLMIGGAPAGSAPAGADAASGDRQTYERGLSRYRARDYRGAIAELDRVVTAPSPDARSLVPSALHHIAQSLRASGSCGPAVRRYEDLLRRFPSYAQAPRAMMEAADCYRRQGQLSAARRWATRAQGYAATAAAAQRELLRLDSMESGTRSRRRPSRRSRDVPAAAAVEQAY